MVGDGRVGSGKSPTVRLSFPGSTDRFSVPLCVMWLSRPTRPPPWQWRRRRRRMADERQVKSLLQSLALASASSLLDRPRGAKGPGFSDSCCNKVRMGGGGSAILCLASSRKHEMEVHSPPRHFQHHHHSIRRGRVSGQFGGLVAAGGRRWSLERRVDAGARCLRDMGAGAASRKMECRDDIARPPRGQRDAAV